jgi:hypothetical protein
VNSVPIGGNRLNMALDHLFGDEVTIMRSTVTTSDIGEIQESWAVLPGHDNLRANVGPVDVGLRIRPQETRLDQVTQIRTQRRVVLNGQYNEIQHGDRMMWDGFPWSVASIIQDPTGTFTQLLIEKVIPGNV